MLLKAYLSLDSSAPSLAIWIESRVETWEAGILKNDISFIDNLFCLF